MLTLTQLAIPPVRLFWYQCQVERLNFQGFHISCSNRKIRPGILQLRYRLVTYRSLRLVDFEH